MKWTKGRLKEKEYMFYFLPTTINFEEPTEEDYEAFFALSEGDKKYKPSSEQKQRIIDANNVYCLNGYAKLIQAKRWRGIKLKIYEEDIHKCYMSFNCIVEDMPEYIVNMVASYVCKGCYKDKIIEVWKEQQGDKNGIEKTRKKYENVPLREC